MDHKFYTDHYVKGPIEEMTPALNRREMDRHILNLVASEICRDVGEIKTFLKSTFTGRTLWNTEMTDADYDKVIEETIALSVKWGLIEKTAKDRLIPTPLGKNTAAKGIALETAVFFLEFLNNADPRNVSDFEILMLLAMSHDAIPVYIPLRRSERGQGGYLYELKQAIHGSIEETKPVFQSVWKISGMLSQEKERAVKKALMMNRWISNAETKEIEESYEVFSGAIKRVGEDFSWLAETLASLAKEIRWDPSAIVRIEKLSQRLIYGVTEKGLALSKIRLRGLGRTYINRMIVEGYDTPEAVAELPLTELERVLPKHLAERLYRHFHREYQKQENTIDQKTEAGIREVDDSGRTDGPVDPTWLDSPAAPPVPSQDTPLTTAPLPAPMTRLTPPGIPSFPRPLAEIRQNEILISALRSSLAGAKDLRALVIDPPALLIDERQMLLFYRGIHIALPVMSFRLFILLAKKPKVVITRGEIYDHLWPERQGKNELDRPYERQITDHKWKILNSIRKGVAGHMDIDLSGIKDLIFTRPRIGYMLYLNQEDVFLFE